MKKTKKTIEAEEFVSQFIADNNRQPTFDEISKGLGISKTAAFARCRFMKKVINDTGTFSFALKEVMIGKQVKRQIVKNDTVICLYDKQLVQMSKSTGVRYSYTPSNEDLLALDWEVVD